MIIRVLVADDDMLNREIARRMLERLGAEVAEANDGLKAVEAFRAARASGRPFRLGLIDLAMPVLDGFGAARRLREEGFTCKLFALSGAEEGPEIGEAGFDGFVQKPLMMEVLKEAVLGAGGDPPTIFPVGAWAEAGSLFRFCPSCASPRLVSDRGRRWVCPDCGFEYFHNVATAAGIVVESERGVLLLERAREPEIGKLGLPGGFVEPGERAEDAALRECREELGWAPERLEFLASYPNLYRYRNVPYATCDIFFRALGPAPDEALLDLDRSESRALRYGPRGSFPWEEIAFESAARALRRHFSLSAEASSPGSS